MDTTQLMTAILPRISYALIGATLSACYLYSTTTESSSETSLRSTSLRLMSQQESLLQRMESVAEMTQTSASTATQESHVVVERETRTPMIVATTPDGTPVVEFITERYHLQVSTEQAASLTTSLGTKQSDASETQETKSDVTSLNDEVVHTQSNDEVVYTQSAQLTATSMSRYAVTLRWQDSWIPTGTMSCFATGAGCLGRVELGLGVRLGNLPLWLEIGGGLDGWRLGGRVEF